VLPRRRNPSIVITPLPYAAAPQHLPHVGHVLPVAALDLGQQLSAGIEVVVGEASDPLEERTAVLPARGHRNEVIGAGQLHVERERLLQAGEGTEQGVLFGDQLEVHVNRALPPSREHGGGAAGEVHSSVLAGFRGERGHETTDAVPVG